MPTAHALYNYFWDTALIVKILIFAVLSVMIIAIICRLIEIQY